MSLNNQILGTMAQIATYDSANGHVTGLTVAGNISANYFLGNIANAIGFNAYSNANVANYLSSSSNIVIAVGNGNISTANGNISTANYFLGNGALLTGIITTVSNAVNGNSNVQVYANGNITVSASGVANVLTVTSNQIIGAANLTVGNANISANYFLGNGSQLTGVITSVSNVINGNSNVQVYANGNITISAASVANVLTVTANSIVGAANLTVGNSNVSANYFLGNGALLTGVVTSVSNVINGNSNVQVYANSNIAFTVAGASNVVTFTANTANFTGNINTTANLTVTNNAASNVAIANIYVLKSSYANVGYGTAATVDTFSSAAYLIAEYNYYWTQTAAPAGNTQFGKFVVSQDGVNAYIDIYSVGGSNVTEQILFTASYATGNVTVSANAISNLANATLRISKTYTSV